MLPKSASAMHDGRRFSHYDVFEVENSTWLKSVYDQNQIAFPIASWPHSYSPRIRATIPGAIQPQEAWLQRATGTEQYHFGRLRPAKPSRLTGLYPLEITACGLHHQMISGCEDAMLRVHGLTR